MDTKYTILLQETLLDYPDNESNAVAVIMPGCIHNCKGCQSPHLCVPIIDDLTAKIIDSEDTYNTFINHTLPTFLNKANTNKIVLSGGDCLSPRNRSLTGKMLMSFLINDIYNKIDICIYTGYDIDEVKEMHLPKAFKFIKCGKYIKELARDSKKTDRHLILASSNQDWYDENYQKLSNQGILTF